MDEQTKRSILAARATMGEAHVDETEPYYSSCGTEFNSTCHADSGIGVEFPV